MPNLDNMPDFSFKFSDVVGNSLNTSVTDTKDKLDLQPRELRNFIVGLINVLNSIDGANSLSAKGYNGLKTTIQTMLNDLNSRKLDQGSDFTGTWQGFRPSQVEPGLSALVESHSEQLKDMTSSLADNATDLEQRGLNIYSLGVIPNDDTKASQNTLILNNLFLNSDDPYFAPPGVIAITDKLQLQENSQLMGTDRTFIKVLNNVDAISLKSRSRLERIKIILPVVHTKSAILLDGTNKIRDYHIKDIRIECTNITSTGVKLTGIGIGNYVVFGTLDNIHVTGGLYDIYIEDTQENEANQGWVNGNRFTNLTLYGIHGIYMKGQPSGNQFDFQYQAIDNMSEAIYCEGNNNIFNGYTMDVGHKNGKVYYLTSSSYQNIINVPQVNTSDTYCVDAGVNNNVPNKYDNELRPLMSKNSYDFDGGVSKTTKVNFFGLQDNCLAYIDKTATVTVTGPRTDAGNNTILFDPKSLNSAVFSNPSVTSVVIEIDLTAKPIKSLYMLGLNFASGKIADSLTIEVSKSSNGVYGETYTITSNRKSALLTEISKSGSVYKIRITITKAVNHATLNPNNEIELKMIYGASAEFYSSPFIMKGGDTIDGYLEFAKYSGNGMILKSSNGTRYLVRVSDAGALTVTAT